MIPARAIIACSVIAADAAATVQTVEWIFGAGACIFSAGE
jgi:uncharacterized membrane protein YgdD (TMEM256/DUF423 family)